MIIESGSPLREARLPLCLTMHATPRRTFASCVITRLLLTCRS
ncbi:hypothetical protein PAMC26510_28365 [Caballeronia sordidicola]|uniref:Uncharacterized protein n=1 Tax=Caballeronia sordidicola TaxID=196367 RepID=A0A242MC33_CABSO|nr:hypothetical protein PAMC26510_28365 [Caballeronia sordidicola]